MEDGRILYVFPMNGCQRSILIDSVFWKITSDFLFFKTFLVIPIMISVNWIFERCKTYQTEGETPQTQDRNRSYFSTFALVFSFFSFLPFIRCVNLLPRHWVSEDQFFQLGNPQGLFRVGAKLCPNCAREQKVRSNSIQLYPNENFR